MTLALIDSFVDHCPGWAYLPLLIVAFLVAVALSGILMRMLGKRIPSPRVRKMLVG